MPDTRRSEERVGAYWDALVLGHDTTGIDIDPALADAIVRVQALAAAPPAMARDRVYQRLAPLMAGEQSVAATSAPRSRVHQSVGPVIAAKDHVAPPDRRPALRPVRAAGHWAGSHLATAALLLLTLTVAFTAIRLQADLPRDETPGVPALVRALESASGAVLVEPLAEANLAAEELGASENEAIFYRLTLSPGASAPYLAGPLSGHSGDRGIATAGAGLEMVQSGVYAVRLDAPVRVHRSGADGRENAIPTGTDVVLGPGDAVVYPDYAARAEIRNAGDEPVVLLGIAIVSVDRSETPSVELPAEITGEMFSRLSSESRALPSGPLCLGLWRLTLPAGESVEPYEATGLEALRVERGAITRGVLRPGEAAPHGRPFFSPAQTSAPFTPLSPGLRRVITSVGNEPAEILAVTIEPAAIGPTTLAP